ncbi:helix-turn-helix domain-containing protein [Microvirga mediterraneensis]|uniref:Helix-turn-helix transcriptional regulator n=1 Tax=Microvirga mediterraneensis TaxID=2754695 RepID=A0A838BRU5_9HYPH|nr:helix-turn-helix transcriptional regulator [Microvirga mediterraneensis]MBA1158277.1 helix-turn-helix transcriptional regulator [Microvirga mediterraneensis]
MTTASTRPVTTDRHVGDYLREWRQRRRLSQMDLALEAEISTRHLSFLETGRSQPSREMVLLLAEKLDMPLRERNIMLVSAGFAPVYSQRSLDDPALAGMRQAVDLVLKGHDPYPALAVDRHWSLVSANDALVALIGDVDPALMKPPVNVLRLSIHPAGLARRIVNFTEWRNHLVHRLHRQVDATGDAVLAALIEELRSYPTPDAAARAPKTSHDYAGIVVPLQVQTEEGVLTLFSTTTIFGTPVDVTLSELAIEAFFPADPETGSALRRLAEKRQAAAARAG